MLEQWLERLPHSKKVTGSPHGLYSMFVLEYPNKRHLWRKQTPHRKPGRQTCDLLCSAPLFRPGEIKQKKLWPLSLIIVIIIIIIIITTNRNQQNLLQFTRLFQISSIREDYQPGFWFLFVWIGVTQERWESEPPFWKELHVVTFFVPAADHKYQFNEPKLSYLSASPKHENNVY